MSALAARVREAVGALGRSFANRDLRRLQLAWLGSTIGAWAYVIALSVYAYAEGGPTAVGLIWVVRLIPAALLSAPLAALSDRFPRKHVMIVSDLAGAVSMVAAAAVIAADGPAVVVYGIVIVATIAGVPFRPAQASLAPRLARNPAELTAANVASSTIESIASFVGPALGGILLALTSVEAVFAVNALSFVWSAIVVLGIRAERDERVERPHEGLVAELTAGAGTIARDADVRAVSLLYTAQTFVAGALNVLVVLVALEVLGTGEAGVGYLNAAVGTGGIVGGFVALVLATRNRLAADFGIGLVLFGAPMVVLALGGGVPLALVALGIVGIGNSLVDVAAITLLQRLVGDEVLGRVLGTLEGMLIGAIGVGAVAAPLFASAVGTETALVVAGLVLPVLTLASMLRLRATDRRAAPPPHLETLRAVPFLGALAEPVLEHLASSVAMLTLSPGEVVIREGEPGERFYMILDGEVEVLGRALGRGESFGEIALLHDVPRTATVTARTEVELLALDRDEFLAALTGHEDAHAAARDVAAARLARSAAGPVLT